MRSRGTQKECREGSRRALFTPSFAATACIDDPHLVDRAGEMRPSASELQGEVRSTCHEAIGGARISANTQPNQLDWKARLLKSGMGETSAKG
ncbi:MAG: hypothetical protein ABSD11_01695 [Methylocella sp.]